MNGRGLNPLALSFGYTGHTQPDLVTSSTSRSSPPSTPPSAPLATPFSRNSEVSQKSYEAVFNVGSGVALPFACPICVRKWPTKEMLLDHLKSHRYP
jgi:hypothetical protein